MNITVYKEILDKIWYSYSSLSGYETCPYQFYLNKIEKEKGISNAHAEIGSYGHDFFQKIFSGKMTPEDALNKCIEEFDENVTYEILDSTKEKKYEALCEYLSNLDMDDFRSKYDVLGVEKQFRWKIEGYKLIGFADLILRRKEDGKILLVDHKSSGHFMKADGTPLKSQEESLEAYKKQMYLYADAMKKTMGIFPDLIVWNHFLDGGKKTIIPFNEEDYQKAIEWVRDTISRIYADEDFEACESYMMCNVLCNYREMCEYRLSEDE